MRHELVRSAAAMLLLLGGGHAHALGLGQVTLGSELASPLRAHIPLTRLAGSGIDPDAVTVDVPGFNEHARLGFPEPVLPADLAVAVVRDADGGARLHLSTQRAVREPVLRFLLRATWPGGSTVREYTLLLDLPQAVVARNPQAFAAGDPGRLLLGATRELPPAAPIARSATASVAPASSAAAPDTAIATRYVVQPGDTLYAIARAMAGTGQAQLAAVARRVFERNPQAFVNGDIDRLRAGATLQLDAVPATATGTPAAAATAAAGLPRRPQAPPGTASAATPRREIDGLQTEIARIQGVVGAERERRSTLRDRLARTERELATLRERDAALSAATEALRVQLTAATAATQATDRKSVV